MQIRLFKPSFDHKELDAVRSCFDRSWVGLGNKVNEFESAWKNRLGCEQAIALNSATAALHLALAEFRFPPGAKVLVPTLTFAATATSILYNDLVPVFVDASNADGQICLSDLEKKWDEDCVAVMCVHLTGHPCPMERIVPWARSKGLKIIEDCAHTSGSEYLGKPLGLWGDVGCFSFEEKKLMTTGDGGLMVTNDPSLFAQAKARRWVGIDKDNWKTAETYLAKNADAYHWYYEIDTLGYKYNMNDLAASIGLEQLKKLDDFNHKRGSIIKRYVNAFSTLENIKLFLPYEPDRFVYQLFALKVKEKERFIIKLKKLGIATGCHYTPLHLQPLFQKYISNCPKSEEIYDELVTIPLHADLTDEEVDYVIQHICEFDNGR